MLNKHKKIHELIEQGLYLQKLQGQLSNTKALKLKIGFSNLVEIKRGKGFNINTPNTKIRDLMTQVVNEALIDSVNNNTRIKTLFKHTDIIVAILQQKVTDELIQVNKELVECGTPPFELSPSAKEGDNDSDK